MKRKHIVYTFKDAKDQLDFVAFAKERGLRLVEDKSYHTKIYDDGFDKETPVASILDIERVELQIFRGTRVMDVAEDYIRQREA